MLVPIVGVEGSLYDSYCSKSGAISGTGGCGWCCNGGLGKVYGDLDTEDSITNKLQNFTNAFFKVSRYYSKQNVCATYYTGDKFKGECISGFNYHGSIQGRYGSFFGAGGTVILTSCHAGLTFYLCYTRTQTHFFNQDIFSEIDFKEGVEKFTPLLEDRLKHAENTWLEQALSLEADPNKFRDYLNQHIDKLKDLSERVINSDLPEQLVEQASRLLDIIRSGKMTINPKFAQDFFNNAAQFYLSCEALATLTGGFIVDGFGSIVGFTCGQPICVLGGGGYGLGKSLYDNLYFRGDGKGNNAYVLGQPTEVDGYKPPKNWNGKKVKNPNGPGYGWPDDKGRVWMPTGPKPSKAHGGPHWDVQKPDGNYDNVYPGGKIRLGKS